MSSTSAWRRRAGPISSARSRGRRVTVGEALDSERRLLNSLPRERFDTAEQATPRVDSKAMVTVRQNRYSVPVGLVGLRVRARIGASEIGIFHDGCRRSRSTSGSPAASAPARSSITTSSCCAQARRAGALVGAGAGARARRLAGLLRRAVDGRSSSAIGRSEAARQIVDVLLLCREHGPARVELAVRGALAAGAHDGRAVAVLARQADRPTPAALDVDARLAGDRRAATRRSLRL